MELPCVEFKHILYTTDNSEDARHAFSYAACLAKQFGAKLTLLHVVPEFKDMVAFDFGIERSLAAKEWFSVSKDYYEEVKRKFEDTVKAEYDGDAIEIEDIVVERGNPVHTILHVANNLNCDLIVMGKKGRSTLEDAMLGDTVNGVLRRSKIPVLVTKHTTK